MSKRKREDTGKCGQRNCKFYANAPSLYCSNHPAEVKEVQIPLHVLLARVPSLKAKEASGLLRLLLETEDGRAAKAILDFTYRIRFSGYTRGELNAILPCDKTLQHFLNQFLEMSGMQVVTMMEFTEFAAAFEVSWYVKGFPLNLWAHLLMHTSLVVVDSQESKVVTVKIHDETGDCALVAFENARRKYVGWQAVPELVHLKSQITDFLSLCETRLNLNMEVSRHVLEYAANINST